MAKWPTKQQEVHFATNLLGFRPGSQHIKLSVVVVVVVVLFYFCCFLPRGLHVGGSYSYPCQNDTL